MQISPKDLYELLSKCKQIFLGLELENEFGNDMSNLNKEKSREKFRYFSNYTLRTTYKS